jgi:hypothetical protein
MTPTILDAAERAAGGKGRSYPFTARWEAVWRAYYGIELRDVDVTELCAATSRSEANVRALSGTGVEMREAWCSVGRRGEKSWNAAFVGVYEALFGDHARHLQPGERGLVAVISKDIAGSNIVANFAEQHAAALGIKTRWTSIGNVRVLELKGCPFGIACFPCSAKAPRGYACPVVICDEIAHWQTDSDEYSNSDESVLAAIRPAQAQFPRAKLVAISSPLGRAGLHYETLAANIGDDAAAGLLCVEGASWDWGHVSEDRCRELEKDQETFDREFRAIPSDNESTAFVRADVERCFSRAGHWYAGNNRPMLALDPASSGNTFAWVVAQWVEPDPTPRYKLFDVPGFTPGLDIGANRVLDDWGRPIIESEPRNLQPALRISEAGGWTGEQLRATTMNVVAAELAAIARRVGADIAFSDLHAAPYLAALASQHGLRIRSFPQTQRSKHEAVTFLRTLMRDDQMVIANHGRLRKDLETYPRRVVGGGFKYGEARRGHHWDYASALVILAHSFVTEEHVTPTTDTYYRNDGAPTKRTLGGRHYTAGR